MRSELVISGVFVPGLLCAALLAFGLNILARHVLTRAGFYHLVWHRALFDSALYILLLGAVVWIGGAVGWL